MLRQLWRFSHVLYLRPGASYTIKQDRLKKFDGRSVLMSLPVCCGQCEKKQDYRLLESASASLNGRNGTSQLASYCTDTYPCLAIIRLYHSDRASLHALQALVTRVPPAKCIGRFSKIPRNIRILVRDAVSLLVW